MPLQFSFVDDWKDLRSVLPRDGHDFWVGSLASVYATAIPDKLQSARIEDLFVEESGYTHCYIAKSSDVKADANRLMDEFGLGMRKKRAGGAAGQPGSIWALVSRNGPSVLSRRRAGLSGNDKALSTEERVRRTNLQFAKVSLQQMCVHAQASKDEFYLTAYSDVGAEACKKKVVTINLDGTMASELFAVCLLAETKNCKVATEHINLNCGLGCRSNAVRARQKAGCVVLMLPTRPLALEAPSLEPVSNGQAPFMPSPAGRQATAEDSDSESSSSSSSSSPSREAQFLDLSKELEKSIDELLLPLLELEEEEVEEAEKAAEKEAVSSGHASTSSSAVPAASGSRSAPAVQTGSERCTRPLAIEDGTKTSMTPFVAPTAAAAAAAAEAVESTELVPLSQALSQASQGSEGAGGQVLRGGKWDEIHLACILLHDWTEVTDVLRGHGHDFYLSSRACQMLEELANAVASIRVEDNRIADMFSHCYIAESRDIKADVDSVINEFGLGLRKSRSLSKPETSGYVFVLVNTSGPTALLKQQLELPSMDRRLSTEVRVRRTSVRYDVSSVAEMITQSRKNQGSFFLTAIKEANVEICKKKVVSVQVDGAFVEERFPRCLLAEVPNCLEACNQIEAQSGLGLRSSKVRVKAVNGCLALFLPAEFKPQAASQALVPLNNQAASQALVPVNNQAAGAIVTPDAKRHREANAAASASAVTPPQKVSAASMVAAASARANSSETAPAASRKRPRDESGSLYQQQVSVLEGRMKVLLPLLLPAELNPIFVQARLEELMRMPQGRLAKFQPVIQKALHSYANQNSLTGHGGQLN